MTTTHDKGEDQALGRQRESDGQPLPPELCAQILCQRKSIPFNPSVSDAAKGLPGPGCLLKRPAVVREGEDTTPHLFQPPKAKSKTIPKVRPQGNLDQRKVLSGVGCTGVFMCVSRYFALCIQRYQRTQRYQCIQRYQCLQSG